MRCSSRPSRRRSIQRPGSLLLSGWLDSAFLDLQRLSKASDSASADHGGGYDFTQVRDELADARHFSVVGTRHSELRLSREVLWQHIAWMVW